MFQVAITTVHPHDGFINVATNDTEVRRAAEAAVKSFNDDRGYKYFSDQYGLLRISNAERLVRGGWYYKLTFTGNLKTIPMRPVTNFVDCNALVYIQSSIYITVMTLDCKYYAL